MVYEHSSKLKFPLYFDKDGSGNFALNPNICYIGVNQVSAIFGYMLACGRYIT